MAKQKIDPWEKANIHVMSHVMNYGPAVFEGVRYYELPEDIHRRLETVPVHEALSV